MILRHAIAGDRAHSSARDALLSFRMYFFALRTALSVYMSLCMCVCVFTAKRRKRGRL